MSALLMKASPHADSINSFAVDYFELEKLRRSVHEAISEQGPVELDVFWIHSNAPDVFHVIAEEISHCSNDPWRFFMCGEAALISTQNHR